MQAVALVAPASALYVPLVQGYCVKEDVEAGQ